MSYPPPYGYPQQPYGNPYGPPPDHPQSTTILVLGILGLVLCQLCAPFAWVMGKRALDEIDASGGALGGRGNVKAGYVCGIVGTLIMLAYLVGIVAVIIISIVAANSSSSY
ncbi:DUF4190 domain-containing protein [Nocardia amikacinitolerans]|uniref:DUF4190 domain-containing protein n=1 Tax=Nocardia amikacinitolerans TaxID=756689 RepID=UPI0020A36AFB|nr:DUF4190 domain-containing protein [Nocardia amikacinitolerans]MCP2276342.1 protein of unknown function (DUF4190) [Nocardia amikacinitolerans]